MGHRIIEINNQSVVAVPHEKIVNLLATSVGEVSFGDRNTYEWNIGTQAETILQILMKTMPTSMFRLLTGQENPIYI